MSEIAKFCFAHLTVDACDDATTCSGHGTCNADGNCDCAEGFSGDDCNTPGKGISDFKMHLHSSYHHVCRNRVAISLHFSDFKIHCCSSF